MATSMDARLAPVTARDGVDTRNKDNSVMPAGGSGETTLLGGGDQTLDGQTAAGESYDDRILYATEHKWREHLLGAAVRAQQFELQHWMSREEIQAMSPEQYLQERYFDPTDKKGLHHWRNLVASEMNSSKSKAGSSFEEAIMDLAEESGVCITGQVHIDESGRICNKKSRHRIDGYVANQDRPENVMDCYVLSKKTTLRERWNQDVWCAKLCKRLIIITRETPNDSTIDSIRLHGATVVYPHAPVTEWTWSYDEFFARMKVFQEAR